ncbi:MAG: hypothetical protein AB7G75_31860 [Candidatus Binatia bacterium]
MQRQRATLQAVLGLALGITVGFYVVLPRGVRADQVIPDDLIVQMSLCVGFDCINNESFGFDTIRMKENNTRIKFDDTSTSAGFPNHDWQLTANDSASGGAERFSIEDITAARVPFTILGNAPSNSLFIDALGRIGLRTATPAQDLHLTVGDTPTVRLEQNTSSGFTAQNWDVAGNETNFFIRDVTNGSRLPFRIRPGAPTSSLDIAADGKVGIGTQSPQATIHVFGEDTADVFGGIGPSPGAGNGTGFNFGYAGASFGRSAGFFNVRNDMAAVAPNPSLRFMTRNVQRMIIDNQGYVGIGLVGTNPLPSQMLDVNGNIRAAGSFISGAQTLTVPDYVFAPDYKLLPLKQLAAYVEKERHLPEIPPAQEIKEKGVNLSEMQMQLLKKIEELTLYTLQQQQMIEKLQQQTQRQDQLIERLLSSSTAEKK